ncbi:phenazine antibiotic biosynthesis-like protein [Siccirubricoccus deserti]|uniref:PhzF family phenazine biosynthesis protein n=1 Tax=Siccirubricoccus deserti TaxID=2013562 RepID=A0A9X0QWG6_9PROT|nr:PhzF family phenazine biosynthesis protein [Siccirubricoccus deserti]MBC4015186.1 PhzF family phenazine biosynthesis protein [Siccirubricoccus deserti]GGC38302.1 phenazine antibiotic biosynthesis-like protein [Siccirubricoccus deserti]
MRAYRFVTLDVFTDRRFGGNQLAVFPDARGMSDAEMQALAAEFNLSETTFVLPPADPANTARVRIFNRVAEMPFAGHPSVGTGFVLAEAGQAGSLRLEQIAGLVTVEVWRDTAGQVTGTAIAAPQPLAVGQELPAEVAAACASIPSASVVTARHAPTLAADGGNPRLLVEVTAEALAAAAPDLAAFRRVVAEVPALRGFLSLYLYRRDGATVRARMFSPLTGTWEDPATGSAATPLAGFLLRLSGAESAALDIIQGVEMGRPSLLRTTARRTAEGIRATVGGGCVQVLRGEALL